ncbi:MAG: hypothetical protein Fur0022_02500 [Anaerolineales bacterium]
MSQLIRFLVEQWRFGKGEMEKRRKGDFSSSPFHPRSFSQSERGQALVETALFSVMAVLLAFGALTLIPVHRTRTAATSAAYACVQFVSQSPNPNLAVTQAELVAWKTLNADWSATLGANYQVQAVSPTGPGSPTGCVVSYQPPLPFNGLLGLEADWATVTFFSQSEAWKARWR